MAPVSLQEKARVVEKSGQTKLLKSRGGGQREGAGEKRQIIKEM